MKIYVCGKEIETKEIIQITSSESRTHGFIIHLVGERQIDISESERYDDYPGDKRIKNDRYRRLKEKVIAEWEKDKTEFIILNL